MITQELDFARALSATSHEHAGETITDAVFAVADSIGAVAGALQRLGLGDAATRRGAIECLVEQVGRTGQLIAGGLGEIAIAVDPPSGVSPLTRSRPPKPGGGGSRRAS